VTLSLAIVFTAFQEAEDLIGQRSSFPLERLRSEGAEQSTGLQQKIQPHRCSLSLACHLYHLFSRSSRTRQALESVLLHTSFNGNASDERLDALLVLTDALLSPGVESLVITSHMARFSRRQIKEIGHTAAVSRGPLAGFSGCHL
jgi:hypothetical protein